MKRLIIFILFCFCTLSIPGLVKRMTGGFRLNKLRVDFPSRPEWNVFFDPEVKSMLDQPFHYLDKGSQCYVFESKDKQIVIKLFRFSDPRSELKISTLFEAARIAYEKMKEETGLLYIHLNRTELGLPKILLTDGIGRSFWIALDDYRFAIQKKAKTFEVALEEALEDPILMRKRIDQFICLLKTRVGKGIYNSDPTLGRNFGFLETRAIELDFGNFKPVLPHTPEIEIKRFTEKFRDWLEKNAQEWVEYLMYSLQDADGLEQVKKSRRC